MPTAFAAARLALRGGLVYLPVMRVLIVGCGYVGLPLGGELVRQGHAVFGLRRNPAAAELKAVGIQAISADVTKLAELKKLPADFDWVINCTASGGGGAADYREIYLAGNRNLLAWLGETPPQKFIYTSSTSVYAQNDGALVTEKSPAEPEVETAQILVEAEKLLLAAVAERRFPAVILRLAGIYGPGRGHWFRQFLRGEARLEGEGERFLNMIHRDDVVGAIIAALHCGRPGEIYNVADDAPVSQREFFAWLAARLNLPLPGSVPVDSEKLRKRGVTNKRVGNARLKGELKYQLRFPDFRAGYETEVARLQT